MRKSTFIILLFISFYMKSQITQVFSLPYLYKNSETLNMTHLSASGDKYYRFDIATFSLIIYNLNFSIYKTITIPSSISAPKIYAVSEDLFDTNNSTLEYLVVDLTSSGGYTKPRVVILNEFGSILFQRDSCTINSTGFTINNEHDHNAFIVKDAMGVKMILSKVYPSTLYGEQFVYTLPGQLTCQECIGGIATLIKNPTQSSPTTDMSLKIFPNPSEESTTIEYTLPAGQTKAELIIYSTDGKEIKRLSVDDFMNKLVLKNSEFPAGSYLLKLLAKDGKEKTKQWINMK